MEEKVLVSSKKGNTALSVSLIIVVIGALAFAVVWILNTSSGYYAKQISSGNMDYVMGSMFPFFGSMTLLPALIIAGIVFWALAGCELTITDKRVYGKAAWGKRVDLPIDKVSAIGLNNLLLCLSVSTSSGIIKFYGISNVKEMHKSLSDLIIERQSKTNNSTTTIKQELPQSNADELKKFKELLDSGIITQDEFNRKKTQLLDL